MARRDIDPFEIGRRGFTITFREFPIWLACAVFPFAAAVLVALARRQSIEVSPWIVEPARWIADAIFDWCWMTALCRSTTLQLLTFPATRGFWLFLILLAGLDAAWWVYSNALGIIGFAAITGGVLLIDLEGPLVQVAGIILLVLMLQLGIWAGLRLMIWPAHCAATGKLVWPRTIWRSMQDHSFDMLIIAAITIGPLLLFAGGQLLALRGGAEAALIGSTPMLIADLILSVFTRGAFDAAALVAYFGIFTRAN